MPSPGLCATATSACAAVRSVTEHVARSFACTSKSRRKVTEARHRVRVGEVPGVLGEPDEVADRRIGRPHASKRRTGQLGRHARRRNARTSVSALIDSIGGKLAGSNGGAARLLCARVRRRAPVADHTAASVRRGARERPSLLPSRPRACGATSARRNPSSSLIVASPRGRAAPSDFGIGAVALALEEHVARHGARRRTPQRSSRIDSGIGTGSTMLLPASVIASPSDRIGGHV